MNQDGTPPYDFDETVGEFDAWANRHERLYSIDAAESASYWLKQAPKDLREESAPDDTFRRGTLERTIALLDGWLEDDSPNLPDSTGMLALHWLKEYRTYREAHPDA